jgi:hypothetical protein
MDDNRRKVKAFQDVSRKFNFAEKDVDRVEFFFMPILKMLQPTSALTFRCWVTKFMKRIISADQYVFRAAHC